MRFESAQADLFIPDGSAAPAALARTTHLCIAAHQDDIEIMAQHGISECFMRPDRGFTGVVVTDGAGSPRSGPYARYSDARMLQVRRAEQRKAAFVGGYAAQVQLGYPSAAVRDRRASQVRRDLGAVLAAARPGTVYLHNPADKHDTHVAVLLRSLEALGALPRRHRPRRVWGCEVWRSLDWMLDRHKTGLPVSDRPHLAAALLGVFDSQISGAKRYDLATIGRRAANATYHASHGARAQAGLSYAVDLTPLLDAPAGALAAAVRGLMDRRIEALRQDVFARLERAAAGRP